MKRKILSVVLALVMVLSMTAVSFAGTAPTLGADEKVMVYLQSGEVTAEAVVDEDYVVTASVTGNKLDASYITIGAAMQNVGSLGVDSLRTEEFTLNTNLSGDPTVSDWMPNVLAFEGATVNASVNGNDVVYTIASTGENAWKATPNTTEAARAAYQNLAAHVETSTADADSHILIPEGTTIQIGKEFLTFGTALTLDDLNKPGDDLTGKVLDAVSYKYDETAEDAYVVLLKEGSLIQVGSSIAELTVDTTITVECDALAPIAEAKLLEAVKGYANARDYNGMMTELVGVVDTMAELLNGETVDVTIETACGEDCEICNPPADDQPTTPPTENPSNPAGPTTPAGPGTPQTDDTTPVGAMGAMALAAVVAMAGVVLTRKRATSK